MLVVPQSGEIKIATILDVKVRVILRIRAYESKPDFIFEYTCNQDWTIYNSSTPQKETLYRLILDGSTEYFLLLSDFLLLNYLLL